MVRYMLPLIPAGLIVLVKRSVLKHRRLFLSSAILFLCLSIALACADYFQSDSDRKLPYLLNRKGYYPEDTWYFGRLSFDTISRGQDIAISGSIRIDLRRGTIWWKT